MTPTTSARARRLAGAVLGACLLVGATAAAASASPSSVERRRDEPVTVYGLTTSNKIVTFSLDRPDRVQRSVRVRGLANDERLIGIDRRPKDNLIYGVTRTRSGAELITVDPRTGQTTFVASLVSAPTAGNPQRSPINLRGREFGFDFNPAADALRIVGDRGQNLRVIPADRTAADGTALKAGDTFTDGQLNRNGRTAQGIVGAAYTNNDNDPATATTLQDIDHLTDKLFVQNPPNDGTLTTPRRLERETGRKVGFDIRTTARGDLAVASLTRTGRLASRVVVVDLASGDVDNKGTFVNGTLRDITLAA
jgi:hypothetical protein